MLGDAQTGGTANDFRFTGQQDDDNANRGLYYLRARSYDPALGRFLQRDSLPFAQRYAYVGDNPANLSDPYGLFPCPGCGKLKSAGSAIINAPANAKAGLDNLGYWDVSLSGCIGVCGTVGFQANFAEGIHLYYGGGVGGVSVGGTVNFAPGQHIATGLSCGAALYVGNSFVQVGGQSGVSGLSIEREPAANKEGRFRFEGTGFGELGVSVGFSLFPISGGVTCVNIL